MVRGGREDRNMEGEGRESWGDMGRRGTGIWEGKGRDMGGRGQGHGIWEGEGEDRKGKARKG